MTFDEALEILELSPREDPEAARRAYLLQLQRNGPEVPPELYARFTAAYEALKSPDVWAQTAREDDSLDDLKREAAARRARRGSKEHGDSGGRIIDPTRVPQRNRSQAETRIIDPDRVPQRSSRSSASEDEAPRIRPRRQDARQSAPTDKLDPLPPPSAPEASHDDVRQRHGSGHTPVDPHDPFAREPSSSQQRGQRSPTVGDGGSSDPWPQTDGTHVESAASAGDLFTDLLSADSAPEEFRPALDLSLGGEIEAYEDISPLPDGSGTGAGRGGDDPPSVAADPLHEDAGAPQSGLSKEAPQGRRGPPARRQARGRPGAKAKAKPLDDTALALFSKIARTYAGVIEFANLVKTLEESPDDALGAMAAELLDRGERVAAAGLLATGFECMEGKPARRWIEVRGCLELVLKLAETASEDHTSYECAQSIMRALNRWRAETEDPRIVFSEAILERWSWLNELCQLPHKMPDVIRAELVHAIRAGDFEEAVLPIGTFARRNEAAMAKLAPVLATTAPKLWGGLEPLLRAGQSKKQEPDKSAASGDTKSGKQGSRRRRRRPGQGSSRRMPAWVWGLLFVLIVGGVFAVVAMQAVQQETEPDDLEVAADGICKAVGGNKPACIEARRVVRAIHDDECDKLATGLIQDFVKAIEAAQDLRGALDGGGPEGGTLRRHEDTLVDTFYGHCQGPEE